MTTKAEDWDTARDLVADNADELRQANDHRAVRAVYTRAGGDSAGLWRAYTSELRKQLGIKYDELRDEVTAREAAALADAAADAPLIELYIAADAEVDSFAVVAVADESECWYGTFHKSDRIYDHTDESGEQAAADKAVFLAGKAREQAGVPAVRLIIHHTHPELSVEALRASATRNGVLVELAHTEANPALDKCRDPGFNAWREIALPALFTTATA